jgi:FkbM family methyltransferase
VSGEILGVVVATPQGVFCVDPQDEFVSRSLLERGAYGENEIRRITDLFRRGSRMLLVGAHVGSLLVPLSRTAVSIVGVEANPQTFRRLQLNVLMNQCRNVRLVNVAASDSSGPIEFVMSRTNSGGSKRMPIVRNELYFADDPVIATVPSARLDEVLHDQEFDLVFMDIEGSELFAMRGMPRILAAAKVVIAEFYPIMIREVAGAGVAEFLQPLDAFSTLLIPSLRKIVHKEDIRATLEDMFENDQCDNGIVFIRDRVNVQFG